MKSNKRNRTRKPKRYTQSHRNYSGSLGRFSRPYCDIGWNYISEKHADIIGKLGDNEKLCESDNPMSLFYILESKTDTPKRWYKGNDKYGYDKYGYDNDGYNRLGYDINGYNAEGFNTLGFNARGYDKDGYDRYGFNEKGFNREGEHYDRFEFVRPTLRHLSWSTIPPKHTSTPPRKTYTPSRIKMTHHKKARDTLSSLVTSDLPESIALPDLPHVPLVPSRIQIPF
jgi:hypothetical protein